MAELIITTGLEIPGKKITKVLGIAKGNTIRARHIGRDVMAGLKTIVGGEIKTYTEMTTQAREEAFNRMINQAIEMKADAIIGVRFSTSMIMQGAAEMLAYGTAVKLK
ncbi:MAG TPA: YbjQ family protein [Candidatus Pacearchaeota archaeon]|nr:YbjQ family protein [Candidatus Pacearchaeota archaeon]